jgi:hypothetical protein
LLPLLRVLGSVQRLFPASLLLHRYTTTAFSVAVVVQNMSQT